MSAKRPPRSRTYLPSEGPHVKPEVLASPDNRCLDCTSGLETPPNPLCQNIGHWRYYHNHLIAATKPLMATLAKEMASLADEHDKLLEQYQTAQARIAQLEGQLKEQLTPEDVKP